ncbi:MAG: YjfB family protein [Lachnospiraceae bacterium]|nr:YjfB family protein [Lachnospiraceae bacterium]MEE1343125.1 YjfB family protein [Lachnospiraceae bacterium]
MDIAEVSMMLQHTELSTQIGTAVMKLSMDNMEQVEDGLTKMMEMSVQPNIGANIDISV